MVQVHTAQFSDAFPPNSRKTDSPAYSRSSSASDMVATLSQARGNRWVPPSVFRDSVDADELVFRKVRGILNRLTAEKFDSLCDQLIHVGITNINVLRGIIVLLFEKALDEPNYSSLYAEVARRLSAVAPNFDDGSGNQGATFRSLLLSKCQEEFENRSTAFAAFEGRVGHLTEEEEERRTVTRRKMLGNIRFIGELGKLKLLSAKVVHDCIRQLLSGKVQDAHPEDIECLCRLMRTVGKSIDTEEAATYMDAYFNRMTELSRSERLALRLRFALEDIIELRKNQWVSRRVSLMEAKPKKISEIHAEADMDHLVQALQARGDLGSPLPGSPGNASPALNRNSSPRGSFYQQGRGSPSVGSAGFNSPVGGMVSMDAAATMGTPDIERLRRISSATTTDTTSLRPHAFVPGGGALSSLPPSARKQDAPAQPIPPPIEKPVLPPPIEKPRFNKARKDSDAKAPTAATPEPAPLPTPEQLSKMTEAMMGEYVSEPNDAEAVQCVRDMRSPDYHPELILRIAMESVERSDAERTCLAKLATALVTKGAVTRQQYATAMSRMLEAKADLAPDVPHIAKYIGALLARGVADGAISFEEAIALLKPRDGVVADDVVFGLLRGLGDIEGAEKVVSLAKKSEAVLVATVSAAEGSKEKFLDLLLEQNLGHIFPVASVAPVVRALASAPDAQPAAVVKAIRETAAQVLSEPDFVLVLSDALFERVSRELGDGADSKSSPPSKAVRQKELQLLQRWMAVVKPFVVGKVPLQMAVLYALQVVAHRKQYPSGFLERHFDALYQLDVCEEEAYFMWKEHVDDSLPGKQRALFQVNKWLNWLETADSESDGDE